MASKDEQMKTVSLDVRREKKESKQLREYATQGHRGVDKGQLIPGETEDGGVR